MAEFLGVVKLGTFYHNGVPLPIPKRPWWSDNYPYDLSNKGEGDIPRFTGSMRYWNIGESCRDKQLSWVKIKDRNKLLLICTTNILNSVSWVDLNNEGYVEGKEITIDGQRYLCRLLSGGNSHRGILTSSNLGGLPVDNEWDRFIGNEDNIDGLPKPHDLDLDQNLTYDDFDRPNNQLWHWWGNSSWCKDNLTGHSGRKIVRGDNTPQYFTDRDNEDSIAHVGWRPVLEILNQAPVITDIDRNLGAKNIGFNISYTVTDSDNDILTITEKLNNTTLRMLNNAPKNENLTIEVTNEMLYKLPLNQTNKIQICVNDGKGGIAYRNYTFTRTNTAPIISDQDRELGVVDRTVKQSYRVHDEENDSINIFESLDDIKLKSFKAECNKEYEISIPINTWITLKNGKHKLTIAATDSNNATSIRNYTFTKKETKINLTLKNALKTDDRANKILITPVWQGIENANVKVEVCNNANDKEPTWEDCTKSVLANQHYNFTNKEKTADTWGINIKFNIEKKEKVEEEIYFNGFGGAFE